MAGGAERSSGLSGNRNWRLLFAGQAVSLIGDAVFDLTLVLWVGTVIAARFSWAPAAVSGVLVAASGPILVIGPIAGVYVDRWDRRRIMMTTDLIRAALVAVLIVVAVAGRHLPVGLQLAAVYGVVALASTASQFFNPARFAMIEAVVNERDRARAFSLAQASVSVASVIGPPLAAPLLIGAGVYWALVINALSFIVSFVSVRLIRLERSSERTAGSAEPKRFRTEFAEGIRFFAASPMLLVLAGALCIYTLGVGALNALDVFFVKDNLNASVSWLGFLTGGFGIGSIAGALLAAPAAKRISAARLFCMGLTLAGVIMIVYARMTLLPAGIVVLALGGIPVGAVSALVGPLVLKATPAGLIGRVTAVLNPLMQLAAIASMALAGFLASTVLLHMHVVLAGIHMHRIDTIFSVSALLMIASGLATLRPMLRAESAVPEGHGALVPESSRAEG